jgi:hypothetical protein
MANEYENTQQQINVLVQERNKSYLSMKRGIVLSGLSVGAGAIGAHIYAANITGYNDMINLGQIGVTILSLLNIIPSTNRVIRNSEQIQALEKAMKGVPA